MKTKIHIGAKEYALYIGAKKYALYIGRKIVEKTLEFLTLPARFISNKVQELKNLTMWGQSVQETNVIDISELEFSNGFINVTGSYPVQNSTYPNAKYSEVFLNAGDRIDVGINVHCRLRYGTTKGVSSGNITIGETTTFTSTISGASGKAGDGYIIAKVPMYVLLLKLTDVAVFTGTITHTTPTPQTPIPVESVGDRTKNLFDPAIVVQGTYTSSSNARVCGRLDLKNNTDYTISITGDYEMFVNFFNKGTTTSASNLGSWFKNKVTISSDKINTDLYDYVLIIRNYSNTTLLLKDFDGNIQLEEGTTATSYVPYGYQIPVVVGDTTTNIYLSEPLRKIGEYADYIDFEGQKVVRNINKADLGTLDIRPYEEAYRRYSVQGIADRLPVAIRRGDGYSTAFKLWNTGDGAGSVENNYFYWGENQAIYLVENTIKNNLQMKQLLTEQYIYYPLAIPTEEQITLPAINLAQGTLTFDTDTTIKPSKISITGDIDNE